MLMRVTLIDGSYLYNIGAIKNDGKVWLLYNEFNGVPTKVPAEQPIIVNKQAE